MGRRRGTAAQEGTRPLLRPLERQPTPSFEVPGHSAVVEVLWWQEKSGRDPKTDPTLYMVPGNPGIIALYRPFLQFLHERTGWQVIGVGHPGHRHHQSDHAEGEDVPGIVNAHFNFLKSLRTDGRASKFILMGHSIGCCLITRMLAKGDPEFNASIHRVYHLMPAMSRLHETIKPLPRLLARHRTLLVLPLAWFLHLLPVGVTERVLRMALGQGMEAEATMMAPYIHVHTVQAVFKMALSETIECRRLDEETIRRHAPQTRWCFAVHDRYSGPETMRQFQEDLFPACLSYVLAPLEVPHAFVVGGVPQTAAIVMDWIKSDLI